MEAKQLCCLIMCHILPGSHSKLIGTALSSLFNYQRRHDDPVSYPHCGLFSVSTAKHFCPIDSKVC